ncbi:MAG: hypothetical protein LUM44_02850 [Pyrinomonadaceae bacterium]|nr:hypothetical protein [Pyrinomonadaceae bacterium]
MQNYFTKDVFKRLSPKAQPIRRRIRLWRGYVPLREKPLNKAEIILKIYTRPIANYTRAFFTQI